MPITREIMTPEQVRIAQQYSVAMIALQHQVNREYEDPLKALCIRGLNKWFAHQRRGIALRLPLGDPRGDYIVAPNIVWPEARARQFLGPVGVQPMFNLSNIAVIEPTYGVWVIDASPWTEGVMPEVCVGNRLQFTSLPEGLFLFYMGNGAVKAIGAKHVEMVPTKVTFNVKPSYYEEQGPAGWQLYCGA